MSTFANKTITPAIGLHNITPTMIDPTAIPAEAMLSFVCVRYPSFLGSF